jgi:glycosyltransferase involved in cell wall biosynthesis
MRPQFSIFTPTFNRAHTLHRVFESLQSQTLRSFEWVVIDDGSTDGTRELVERWMQAADFPIRYSWQSNSGKHIAHNRALKVSQGEFFAPIDSDDALMPRALERVLQHWMAIPPSDRTAFAGVWGLCQDQYGAMVGDYYPQSPFDADLREVNYVRRVKGEKWGAIRTDVLRHYPFPEIRDTQFVPEASVWLAIAEKYRTRCVNETFRVYYVNDTATGPTLSDRDVLTRNAPGRLHYCVWLLNNNLTYFFSSPMPFLKAAIILPIVARHSGKPFLRVLGDLRGFWAKALVCLALPLSTLIAWYGLWAGTLGASKSIGQKGGV